jgi:hypothetical protein
MIERTANASTTARSDVCHVWPFSCVIMCHHVSSCVIMCHHVSSCVIMCATGLVPSVPASDGGGEAFVGQPVPGSLLLHKHSYLLEQGPIIMMYMSGRGSLRGCRGGWRERRARKERGEGERGAGTRRHWRTRRHSVTLASQHVQGTYA